MKYRLNPGIHFILFLIVGISYLILIDKYILEEGLGLAAVGLFSLVTGIWGNVAGLVFLKIPYGPKSYKIINYVLIVVGIICITYGSYEHFFN